MNWEVILWTCVTLVIIMGVFGIIMSVISATNMKKRRENMKNLYEGLAIGSQVMFAGGIYIGGTHPASNGGAYLSLLFGMAGLKFIDNKIVLNPHLPEKIKGIEFKTYNFSNNSFTSIITTLSTTYKALLLFLLTIFMGAMVIRLFLAIVLSLQLLQSVPRHRLRLF